MPKKYSVSWTNVFFLRTQGEVQIQIQAPYTEKLLTLLSEPSPLSDFIWGKGRLAKEAAQSNEGQGMQREGPEEMTYNLLGFEILEKAAANAGE